MDQNKISLIKRKIATLEWDLVNIENEKIIKLKTKQISQLKSELEKEELN